MKFAIISLALPPAQSGQSLVLYRLLKNVNSDSYCLITQKNTTLYLDEGNCTEKLPAHYHFLFPDYVNILRLMHILKTFNLGWLCDTILSFKIRQVKKILIKEKCDAVVGCTGDLFGPPAAFLASKSLGLPFIFYLFDYYSFQWMHPVFRSFAEKYESKIVHGASHVIVPNECMSKEYQKRYGVSPVVIHNPFDLDDYEALTMNSKKVIPHEDMRIVYTGAIYDAHYNAFQNLIKALNTIGRKDIFLHVYTTQSAPSLAERNIKGPVVIHKHLPNSAMPAVQRSAEILFLPLAFNSVYPPEIINTSSPGKIGEYLAASRPILVHAPKESFVARYFKKFNCGFVVDDDDPEKLAQAIILLLNDAELRNELITNAYVKAKTDFNVVNVRNIFFKLLNV